MTNKQARQAAILDLVAEHVVGSQEDLRGFEWFALWRYVQGDRPILRNHADRVNALAASPGGVGIKPIIASDWTLLPLPLSPTTPRVSPSFRVYETPLTA